MRDYQGVAPLSAFDGEPTPQLSVAPEPQHHAPPSGWMLFHLNYEKGKDVEGWFGGFKGCGTGCGIAIYTTEAACDEVKREFVAAEEDGSLTYWECLHIGGRE